MNIRMVSPDSKSIFHYSCKYSQYYLIFIFADDPFLQTETRRTYFAGNRWETIVFAHLALRRVNLPRFLSMSHHDHSVTAK